MKNGRLLLFIFSLLLQAVGFGQKIQYSRQTIKRQNADAMQLVTDIAGNHHLLFFTARQKPKIFVFNKQLQLIGEKSIEVNLEANAAIQILPFSNYYYLYAHAYKTQGRSLIKIDSEGETADLSGSLMLILDSVKIDKTATLQLFNHQQTFSLLSHVYTDSLKQIQSTILELSKDLKRHKTNLISFPFDLQNEVLHQAALVGGHLLTLKTGSDAEKGNFLEIAKLDLHSGEALQSVFSSPSHIYLNPAFTYSAKDSTLLLYSMLRESIGSVQSQRIVFVTRLNDSLRQTTALGLLKEQFRNRTNTNFLLVNGQQPQWLSFANSVHILRKLTRTYQVDNMPDEISSVYPYQSRTRYYGSSSNHVQLTAIRLSVLDETFTKSKDSIVENKGQYYTLQPEPYAQITINGTAYLVLVQNFSEKKRALVALHANGGEIITTPLPVYDRYEYNLSLLKPGSDYFILPYHHKRETGLLKITLTQ